MLSITRALTPSGKLSRRTFSAGSKIHISDAGLALIYTKVSERITLVPGSLLEIQLSPSEVRKLAKTFFSTKRPGD